MGSGGVRLRAGSILLFTVTAVSGALEASTARIVFEPSLRVLQVQDDNVMFDAEQPVRDRIRRITPGLDLRVNSSRWSARGTFSFDSEQYANQTHLDHQRARQQSSLAVRYIAGPRLELALEATDLRTNSLAELTIDTGLIGTRVEGRKRAIGSSVAYELAPTLSVFHRASFADSRTGRDERLRQSAQSLGVERKAGGRDTFTIEYSGSRADFLARDSQSIEERAILAGWTHKISRRTEFTIRAGSRFSASLSHQRRHVSLAVSAQQTRTPVIGYEGLVKMRSVQTRFVYDANRTLAVHVEPAIIRSELGIFDATVYRLSAGAQIGLSPKLALDIGYMLAEQEGGLNEHTESSNFARSTLSLGFSTRWRTDGRYQRDQRW